MASSRPMTIKAVYKVGFSKPRNRAIQQTKAFFDLARTITNALDE